MPNLRSRIERLEAGTPAESVYPGLVIQNVGETEAECLHRHFGAAGPPADQLVIVRVIV
jgi:hypothetical protein